MNELVKGTLADHGLNASAILLKLGLIGSEKLHQQNLELIRFAADVGENLGQTKRPILESTVGGRPQDYGRYWSTMVRRLNEWDRLAIELDVTIAIKAHVSTALTTPDQLLALLREAGSSRIAVAFDQSHYQLVGLDLDESFPPLSARTQFIHIKDAIGDASDFRFLPPGEGPTNYDRFFSLLLEQNYHGPIVVEISRHVFSRPDYQPITVARRCFRKLAPLLGISVT
jgi:sugar phosphate isomerase/epimerase